MALKSMLTIKELFFDGEKVKAAFDRAEIKVFSKIGAFIRSDAQRSIRTPTVERVEIKNLFQNRRPIEELTKKARQRRRIIFNMMERGDISETVVRARPSRPGKPPKNVLGTLKRLIFFSLDPGIDGVVIGPVKVSSSTTDAPHVLEFGGINQDKKFIAARPYMRPALEKNIPKLESLWQDSVTG